MINYKDEKGGVTLYVLGAMLLIIITLLAIYVSTTNQHVSDLEVAEQIKSIYEKDLNRIDIIYNEIISAE